MYWPVFRFCQVKYRSGQFKGLVIYDWWLLALLNPVKEGCQRQHLTGWNWWFLIAGARCYELQFFSYLLTFSPSDLWPLSSLSSILFPLFSFFMPFPFHLSPYFFEPWSPLRKSPESFGPAPPKAGKLSAFSFEPILPFLFPLSYFLISLFFCLALWPLESSNPWTL